MTLSPTQRALRPEDVDRYVRASLGTGAVDCGPLSGGGYATVWWVRLADGREAVLKVAPPAGVGLLRYEQGLAAAEAAYFRLVAASAPTVPVPELLHHGADPALGEWLLMTRLPGRPLTDLEGADVSRVRYDLGVALATLHRASPDAEAGSAARAESPARAGSATHRFGYSDGRAGGATWRAAFTAMVDELLVDAVDWDVDLPVAPERIRAAVDRHGGALDEVRRPAPVHFDGWDGNVLAAPDDRGGLRLSGLVDGERWLHADPLMDLVSPVLLRRAEDEPDDPFVRGYADAADEPLVFDEGVRHRLGLYRMHLYLLMNVEMPSRGMTPDGDPDRYSGLRKLLTEQVADLLAP